MIIIDGNFPELSRSLQALHDRVGNLRPALLEIGEEIADSTIHRFQTGTGPDGNKWLLNSPATLLAVDESGELRKKGDKPLVNHGDLAASIHYQAMGQQGVEIGSNLDQAAMMQFGGTKAEFPHLWGDIPARPYLGLSAEDEENILNTVADYLI